MHNFSEINDFILSPSSYENWGSVGQGNESQTIEVVPPNSNSQSSIYNISRCNTKTRSGQVIVCGCIFKHNIPSRVNNVRSTDRAHSRSGAPIVRTFDDFIMVIAALFPSG